MSYRRSLLRVLALSSVGSGLVFSDYATDSRASVLVSILAPSLDSLSWSWRTLLEKTTNPALGFYNESFQHRIVPLFLSVPNNDPSSDFIKDSSAGVVYNSNYLPSGSEGDAGGPKHSCNCLGRDTIANAAAKVGPAVVNISVPKGVDGIVVGVSMGSGTIIGADGTILTCAHVVADSRGLRSLVEGKVNVALQDGRTYEGKVVNIDRQSDIAIVKITSKTPLPTANLGSSGKLRPGDWVVAVGCPLTLQNTITAGIISCVDRKSTDLGLGGFRREYLQTDCAINEGNSGGPLVNMDGELVGVNIMKVQGAQGLGFSVPIDVVCKIMDHFKTQGRVIRPWLGLKMIELNEMIAAQLKEKNTAFPSATNGVFVAMVTPGSPADRAGFLPTDVVIEFDGKRVSSIKEITDIMWGRVGQPLKAVVIRGTNKSVTLTVIPEEAKPDT